MREDSGIAPVYPVSLSFMEYLLCAGCFIYPRKTPLPWKTEVKTVSRKRLPGKAFGESREDWGESGGIFMETEQDSLPKPALGTRTCYITSRARCTMKTRGPLFKSD